jgi:hypothetical protein
MKRALFILALLMLPFFLCAGCSGSSEAGPDFIRCVIRYGGTLQNGAKVIGMACIPEPRV